MPSRATSIGDAPLVLIVDDDGFIREALADLLRSVGIECAGFASTLELLQADIPDRLGCILLDVRLPGLGGLELHGLEDAARNLAHDLRGIDHKAGSQHGGLSNRQPARAMSRAPAPSRSTTGALG